MSEEAGHVWLTTDEVAKRFRVDPATVRGWRHTGYGPPSARIGKKHLYRLTAIVAFEDEQERKTEAARKRWTSP